MFVGAMVKGQVVTLESAQSSPPPIRTTATMRILMDRTLTEYANQVFETARLRRNGDHSTRDRVFAEVLAKLEAVGDAMRFVDTNGRIGWKATQSLCDYLKDLERDAHDDLGDI